MIAMEAEGSRERCLTRKCLPCMAGFVLVAGIFMIVAGSVVHIEEQTHAAISSLQIQTAPIVLLIAGVLCLCVGFVGFYCCCKYSSLNQMRKPLIIFIVLLALAAILALVAGGLGVDYSNKLKSGFEMDLKEKLGMYGKTGLYETLVNIDRLQKEDKCCGVINYVDWRNTTYGGRRYDKVPDSCCIEEKHACGFGFKIDKIKHRGCSAVAMKKMNKDFMIVGIGGIVFGIIEIIWCVVFCLCCHREKSPAEKHKDRVLVTYNRKSSEHGTESEAGSAHGGKAAAAHGDDAAEAQEGDAAEPQRDDAAGTEGSDAAEAQGGDAAGAQGSDALTDKKSPTAKVAKRPRKSKTSPETKPPKV